MASVGSDEFPHQPCFALYKDGEYEPVSCFALSGVV